MDGSGTLAADLARRLVASGDGERDPSQPDGALHAINELRVDLTRFLGVAGVYALIARALAVAKGRAPSLESVRVASDGSLAGLTEAAQTHGLQNTLNGEFALLTQLLELLVTFIGEAATLHVVRDVRIHADLDNAGNSAKETK